MNECGICKEPFDNSVYVLKQMTHHIDGNHDNGDLRNLMQIHLECHTDLHMTGETLQS